MHGGWHCHINIHQSYQFTSVQPGYLVPKHRLGSGLRRSDADGHANIQPGVPWHIARPSSVHCRFCGRTWNMENPLRCAVFFLAQNNAVDGFALLSLLCAVRMDSHGWRTWMCHMCLLTLSFPWRLAVYHNTADVSDLDRGSGD